MKYESSIIFERENKEHTYTEQNEEASNLGYSISELSKADEKFQIPIIIYYPCESPTLNEAFKNKEIDSDPDKKSNLDMLGQL